MKTLSEFLNDEENQKVVLEKIIEALRLSGEWGRYGLFAKIAEPVGFSQSYVSKTLKGKMPLRENFVQKMAEYLGVSVAWLCGNVERSYEEEVEYCKKVDAHFDAEDARDDAKQRWNSAIVASAKMVNYKPLVTEFMKIPEEKRQEAVDVLSAMEWLRITQPPEEVKKIVDQLEAAKLTPPPSEEE